jgi:hypothetical protein
MTMTDINEHESAVKATVIHLSLQGKGGVGRSMDVLNGVPQVWRRSFRGFGTSYKGFMKTFLGDGTILRHGAFCRNVLAA